jgi:hypothetical protein
MDMREDWKKTYTNPKDGNHHWTRDHGGCRISIVGNPGEAEPTNRDGYQVHTIGAYSHGGCISIPADVDPDAYADAVAELLAGFAASLHTRAMAMLADTAEPEPSPGPTRCPNCGKRGNGDLGEMLCPSCVCDDEPRADVEEAMVRR